MLKKDTKITAYLLTVPNNKNIKLIKNLEKVYHFFKLKIISIEKFHFNDIGIDPLLSHINYATFFRFAIDSIEWVDKLLYVDTDTVIDSDITEIFHEKLEWNIVWVCSDMPTLFTKKQISDLCLDKKYFNAWILLIDLEKWKSFNVSKKCIDLLKTRSYPCNDQDVLNIVLKDSCRRIPWKYNVQTWYFFVVDWEEEFCDVWFEKKYYIEAIKNPTIIHYTGWLKPRNLFNEHPLRFKYDKILWKSAKMNVKTLSIKEYMILLIHKVEDFLLPNMKNRRKLVINIKKVVNPRYFISKNK